MLWVGCLSLPLFFGNCSGSTANADSANKTDSLKEEQHSNQTRTYGTAEVTDTAKIGTHTYTYKVVCYADTAQAVFKDSFGDVYYQNKVDLTLWRDGESVGTKHFVKADFIKNVSNEVRQQMEEALLTGFIYDPAESDAGRLCFRTTIGWGGEGPKFKVYIATDASATSITYDDADANAYEAPDA